MVEGEREERFTYGEVHRYAGAGGQLPARDAGVKPRRPGAARLARTAPSGASPTSASSARAPPWSRSIRSSPRPRWSTSPAAAEAAVVPALRGGGAGPARPVAHAARRAPELPRQVHSLAQAMEGDAAQPGPHRPGAEDAPRRTTWPRSSSPPAPPATPKGVMLTHRNFASLVAKLAGAFDIGVGDGAALGAAAAPHLRVLRGLPHARSSRGAEITYLDELTADRLGDVLETGRVTGDDRRAGALAAASTGRSPRSWPPGRPSSSRRIKALMAAQRRAAQPQRAQPGQAALLAGAPQVRRAASSSWSPAARRCPDDVHKAFHALGFNIAEGYGLTEAAPVLTVAEPEQQAAARARWASALPGIELQDRRARRRRHRRGARQGPERDGRLLRRPRGHRRGAQGRLAAHRRPRAARRRGPALPGRPQEGRHHRRQREERVPGRARGALRRARARSRSSRSSACPTRPAARRSPASACPTTRTAPREEVRARAGGALPPTSPPRCRSTGG